MQVEEVAPHSRLCIHHFRESDCYVTNSGILKLKMGTIPRLHVEDDFLGFQDTRDNMLNIQEMMDDVEGTQHVEDEK